MRRGNVNVVVLACIAGGAGLCAPATAQENRFDLGVRVVETYDTNILRTSPARGDGPRDNLSISPQATLDYQRRFGRQSVFLNAAAGYNFNSRFRGLDRETIVLSGGSNLRFGARCAVDPAVTVQRAQSDLEDLGDTVVNTVTVADYSIQAACPRPAGFYPAVALGLFRVDNSAVRRERDQSVVDGRAGIVYRRPGLGEAELFVQILDISRNRRIPIDTGVGTDVRRDKSDVTTIGLQLSRGVGTRVSASASAGYTTVDAKAPGVPDFSGVTYRGSVSYRPAPRLGFTAGFGRSISARGNLGTSYYITTTADLGASARLTARTSAGVGVQLAKRRFRGEDAGFRFGPRGDDRQVTATANVSYAISRPISLDLSARYRNRDADNDFYDFSSFATTLTASLKL